MQIWLNRVEKFKSVAHVVLGVHEDSKSRIIRLSSTYEKLKGLNIKQDDLFRQAFTCLEKECFRAAHVMAWAAFMDFLENKLYEDKGVKLKSIRPSWRAATPEDLRENQTEFHIIDTLDLIGLCAKSEKKALHGLLNKRNECAHPTDYFPELNDGLGYITELFARIEVLKTKKII